MIKDLKTTVNRNGKIKVEIQFDTKEISELQERLDKLVEFINEELEQQFKISHVNFYDDSKAVEDLKNIFKTS
jgi:cell division protein FtsX